MNRPARGASGWLLLAAIAGLLGIAGAFILTPEFVGLLKGGDGTLSPNLLDKVWLLRWMSLFGGGLLLALAGFGARKGVAALGAVTVSVVAAIVFVQSNFPNNLLSHPKRLSRAILGQDLLLKDYDPVPSLKVPVTEVKRAKFPTINIHAHFERTKDKRTADEMVAIMDNTNVVATADLDGGVGKFFQSQMEKYASKNPERFLMFASIGMDKPMEDWDYFYSIIDNLGNDQKAGARGLKIWKQLGLMWRDEKGELIHVDDPRLDPMWTKAAELKLPVLIHLADPPAAWQPIDGNNERYEQYTYFSPEWWFGPPQYPRPATILSQFEKVLEKHPDTQFIGAHLMMLAQDLQQCAGFLDRHPNLNVDLSAMVSELGRQPFTARDFLIKYQDRVLFGTDGNPNEAIYAEYFRVMETADQYFEYPKYRRYNAGRWYIYGLDLPDDVLKKMYHDNAARALGIQ